MKSSSVFGVFSVIVLQSLASGKDLYVSPGGANIPPYTNWLTAATSIQTAVIIASTGDQVWVTNGVYNTGGTIAPLGYTTNRITVTNAITIQSMNGPEVTVIQGAYTPGTTNGTSSIRCAWLESGAVLSGFTLTNGSTATLPGDNSGGGAYCRSAGSILTNCVIWGNSGYANGGGVYQGTLQSCYVVSNTAMTGGGCYNSRLVRSEVKGNRAVSGGGVYCQSNGIVSSGCLIAANSVSSAGGGAYQGTWSNCTFQYNRATGALGNGGGVFQAVVQNCTIRSNTAYRGGGAYDCLLIGSALLGNFSTNGGGGAFGSRPDLARLQNCTVIGNRSLSTGAGASGGSALNSILFYNQAVQAANYSGTALTNCCTDPLPTSGSQAIINTEPMLLSDGIHLQSGSPCLGAGSSAFASGVDWDGQPWTSPPAIGCDEWNPQPVLINQPRVVPGDGPGRAVLLLEVAGQAPYCWWTKDGSPIANDFRFNGANSSNLGISGFDVIDAGAYQVVASNSFGMVTSAVVTLTVACVDANTAKPSAPYSSWATAASSIQDAVDIGGSNTVVLVTNGVYGAGGRAAPGDSTTNRVVIDRPLTVLSMNGPDHTAIEGTWDPASTNGSGSIRCIWVGEGAMLGGFILRNGSAALDGGGAWSAGWGLQDSVVGCLITNCSAGRSGGGAFQGRCRQCVLAGNLAGNGGGLSSGVAQDCVFSANNAGSGGGAYQSYIRGSTLEVNTASQGGGLMGGQANSCIIATNSGGGIRNNIARNCRVLYNTGNGAAQSFVQGSLFRGNTPSGASGCTSLNCTFIENGSGTAGGYSTNCIFWANQTTGNGGTRINCSLQPGDIANVFDANPLWLFPNLLSDGWHLASNSPCIGRGTNAGFNATDLDGQPYNNPPSIGCDEWNPQPLIVSQPRVLPSSTPGHARVVFELAGQGPYCWWAKDGVPLEENSHFAGAHSSSLEIAQFGVADAGAYQVVASNTFGIVTSAVVSVSVACVDPNSVSPIPPYGTWATAARSIQDAVDSASEGTVVLVANGVYSTGGRSVPGDSIINRLVLDNPVTVLSVNGAQQTVIEGAWDPVSTNGAGSVRCVWLGDGAVLGGFTLRNGSSPSDGGGAWSGRLPFQPTVVGCVITNCRAAGNGGGTFQGWLQDCMISGNASATNGGGAALAIVDRSLLQGNRAVNGGGAFMGVARGCRIVSNSASSTGGGAAGPTVLEACAIALNQAAASGGVFYGSLFQCTVVSNLALVGMTAGVDFSSVWNSILYFNSAPASAQYGNLFANAGGSGNYYGICYSPYRALNGITNNPELMDLWHLAATSPCRNAGQNLGILGISDIDGDPWASPPSIGCDEVVDSQLVGPLAIQLLAWPEVAAGGLMPVAAIVSGRASAIYWDFGDGTVVTNAGFSTTHAWTSPGEYLLKAWAYNLDNPGGVMASSTVHVLPVMNPVFTTPTLTNKTFSVQFLSQPGLTYQLQTTTNLSLPLSWQALRAFYSTGGVMTVSDPQATDPVRFYRLQAQ